MNDREAIAAVIAEMYAMISGPKGPRDWSRHANCFHPQGCMIRTWVDETGRPAMMAMSLDDYARDTASFFEQHDFFEVETGRRIDLFGNVAQAWSAYEARRSPDETVPERRGINAILLVRNAEREWRIVAMAWDNERPGLALPEI
ncbi:MAG: hypothetical protein ACT4OE_07220 [Sphingosinicella sp.]